MLALSSQMYSSVGWPLEVAMDCELNSEDLLASCTSKEAETSSHSLGFSPAGPELDDDDYQCPNNTTKEFSSITKKLSHNAYERDRRKKMNELYSSLRLLLPENDHSKKLSIPCTVSRILKYIPEIQRKVERLKHRKDEILLRASREGACANLVHMRRGEIYPVVSATCLNNREIMIQICIFNKTTNKFLSKILRILEYKGLQLLNASTLSTHADRTFYSLHLQAREAISTECKNFCEHLIEVVREQASLA